MTPEAKKAKGAYLFRKFGKPYLLLNLAKN